MGQRFTQRRFCHFARRFHLFEFRGFVDIFTDPQANQYQYGAHQEWDTPAPGEELLFAKHRHQWDNEGCHQHADSHARLRDTAEKAFAFFRRVFIGQQQRAAPFSADTHTLDDTHQNQQNGGPDTDLVIGRQQTDHDGCTSH